MRSLFKPLAVFAVVLGSVLAGFISASGGGQRSNEAPDQKALLDAARETYERTVRAYETGNVTDLEQLYRWSKRWMDAEYAQASDKPTRAAAITRHLTRMRNFEDLETARYKEGSGHPYFSPIAVAAATYYRLEAELLLADANKK